MKVLNRKETRLTCKPVPINHRRGEGKGQILISFEIHCSAKVHEASYTHIHQLLLNFFLNHQTSQVNLAKGNIIQANPKFKKAVIPTVAKINARPISLGKHKVC